DTEDENDLEDTVEIDVRPIVDVKENSSVTGKQQFFYGFTDPESTVTLMARNSQGQKILIGTAKSRADGLYVLDRLSNLPAGTYDIITRTTDWEEVTQNVTISKTEDNGKIAIQNFADVNFKELTKIAEQNKADIFKNGHINLERIKIVTDNPRPELTGRLDMNKYESVKYLSGVAVWRSRTLVSKLTFNDDGTFTTKPPVDLPDGEHQVSFYIRDESTREDSKSQITFAVISKKEALANAEDKAKASYRVADVFNAIENAPAYWLLVLLIPFVGYFAYSFGQRRNKRLVERYKDVSEARGKNASETNG
ncbi:MAG: hypothetical protein NTZ80_01885, partial [Patescibacteria group bacterium]|nr:hypothetical protein [Patescibacteria group bacterium]